MSTKKFSYLNHFYITFICPNMVFWDQTSSWGQGIALQLHHLLRLSRVLGRVYGQPLPHPYLAQLQDRAWQALEHDH